MALFPDGDHRPYRPHVCPRRADRAGERRGYGRPHSASKSLLRIGMGSELFHQAIAVFLVLALYRLFKPVNEQHAKLMVALGALVSVPIMFVNVLNEAAALILVSGADFPAPFEKSQLDALAFLFIRLHGLGTDIAAIFWGLWLFPFGLLVIKSGFIPKILGYIRH